jgi:hypothetical protein
VANSVEQIVIPTNIKSVGAELDSLELQMCEHADATAYFVALYRATTACCANLADAIENSSHPQHRLYQHLDRRLVIDIVRYFAPRFTAKYHFFRADLLSHDDPWHRVLKHARYGSPSSILLAGAHTHIAFDLPLVLSSDLHAGDPLFDSTDRRQTMTLKKLNTIFMDYLPQIMINTANVEAKLKRAGVANVGGTARLLYHTSGQRMSRLLWQFLLGLLRHKAQSCAAAIRVGDLHESDLAIQVDRRNQIFLDSWAMLGRRRNT